MEAHGWARHAVARRGRLGKAWFDEVWLGEAGVLRQGMARLVGARQGRHGTARIGEARQGRARRGRQGQARLGKAGQGQARRGRQNK